MKTPQSTKPKSIDLAGQKFGRLTAIRLIGVDNLRKAVWECLCECGKTKEVIAGNLRSGGTLSCGCLKAEIEGRADLTGRQFGRLLVVEKVGIDSKRKSLWRCECACGTEKVILGQSLTAGLTVSCGCFHKEKVANERRGKPAYTRGEFGQGAKDRLINGYRNGAKSRGYEWYLDEHQCESMFKSNCNYCGISPKQVTKAPRSFGFYTYNGIDRVDNTQGYTIDNCVSCCVTCNRAKHTLTAQQFEVYLSNLTNHRMDSMSLGELQDYLETRLKKEVER